MGLIQQMIKNRKLTLLLKTKTATLIGERQNTRLKMDKVRQFCGLGASGRKMTASWLDYTMMQKKEISSLLNKKYQTITVTLSDEERWNIKFSYVFLYVYNK